MILCQSFLFILILIIVLIDIFDIFDIILFIDFLGNSCMIIVDWMEKFKKLTSMTLRETNGD